MKTTIESNCVCEYDEEEDLNFTCYGDCWEWQKEDVSYVIEEWQKKNSVEDDQPVKINGTNMNWNHVSGYAMATPKTMLEKLTLNGDFRLTFEFDEEENVFNCVRSSHDEMGALFTFEIMKACDKCGEPINADVHAEELGMCVECSHDYFDHKE